MAMSEPKHKAMATRTTILLADCGSHGFGLNVATSDYDLKGVCVEDFDCHLVLEGKFDQFIEKVELTTNYPGHDIVIYSLEKFIRLAIAGNPDVTPLLFSRSPEKLTPIGEELQALVPWMIHRGWAKRFLGYMESQRQKLVGERGQKRVTRNDLVEKYGHDTKYLYHLLRLGIQGVELMETGLITMPFTGSTRDHLLDIRNGKITLNECLQEAGDLERRLRDFLTDSQWPDYPNSEYVNDWLREIYWSEWAKRRASHGTT